MYFKVPAHIYWFISYNFLWSCQTYCFTTNGLETIVMAVLLVSVSRSMWPSWPFVCDLCSPVPSISWRKADGNPLPGKIKINHSSGVLEIPYFRPEDAGVYECVAENSRGRNVARGQLLFQSKSLVNFCFLFSRRCLHNFFVIHRWTRTFE